MARFFTAWLVGGGSGPLACGAEGGSCGGAAPLSLCSVSFIGGEHLHVFQGGPARVLLRGGGRWLRDRRRGGDRHLPVSSFLTQATPSPPPLQLFHLPHVAAPLLTKNLVQDGDPILGGREGGGTLCVWGQEDRREVKYSWGGLQSGSEPEVHL